MLYFWSQIQRGIAITKGSKQILFERFCRNVSSKGVPGINFGLFLSLEYLLLKKEVRLA